MQEMTIYGKVRSALFKMTEREWRRSELFVEFK